MVFCAEHPEFPAAFASAHIAIQTILNDRGKIRVETFLRRRGRMRVG